MSTTKSTITPFAEVTEDENGIIVMSMLPDAGSTIEEGKQHLQQLKKAYGMDKDNPKLVLVKIDQFKKGRRSSKGLRDFMTSKEIAACFIANAFVVNSNLVKIGVNLFMKFNKPPYPVKAFAKESQAKEWLLSI